MKNNFLPHLKDPQLKTDLKANNFLLQKINKIK